MFSHRLIALTCDLEIDRRGKTLDDDRSLQSDNGARLVKRGSDFVAEYDLAIERIVHAERSVLFWREFVE